MKNSFISAAEAKHRYSLKEFCRSFFESSPLPSHDHSHHERVWLYASRLLTRLYDAGMVNDPLMAEKTIIASYTHDTGLTRDSSPSHGRESRHICESYLAGSDLSESDRNEILDAVEKHDIKEYTEPSDPGSLSAIISVADDMDAFGNEGIARYEEIYRLRGISSEDLPKKIIANAISRFRHLERTYTMFPDLVAEERERADILVKHFNRLIQ